MYEKLRTGTGTPGKMPGIPVEIQQLVYILTSTVAADAVTRRLEARHHAAMSAGVADHVTRMHRQARIVSKLKTASPLADPGVADCRTRDQYTSVDPDNDPLHDHAIKFKPP